MISFYELSLILQREWLRLELEANTEFVKGMTRGLKLANALAKDLALTSTKKEPTNPIGNRVTYYRAILTARHQLKLADRNSAMTTLERVINRVEAHERKKKGITLQASTDMKEGSL